ncbi:MAG: prepilin-type N-terminal cleavage/methylation domain-containing protein [Patescibacteria group bacterium]
MKHETINMKRETREFFVRLKLNAGYTLIEFLIVISILSLSVGSVLLLLTSVIKGANQANVTSEVKQNGQNVLDSLQTQIRGGTDVRVLASGELTSLSDASYDSVSGVFVTLASDEKLTIVCFNTKVTDKNGWIGVAKGNASSSVPVSQSSFTSLTSQNPISGVDIICTDDTPGPATFQVNLPTSSVRVIIINFTANQGKTAPSRADFLANAQFRTTISQRLYQ